MNNINKKQNTSELLLYLFAQRKLYSRSKGILSIFFCVSLFFYILGAISFIQNNIYFKLFYVLWLMSFIILSIRESNKLNNAANIQEIVDRTLFGFDLFSPKIKTTELHKLAIQLKNKYTNEYEFEVTHNGEDGGVKDWYSNVEGVPRNRAIILCQIENCEWELNLRREFQRINILLFALLIIIYLIIYRTTSIVVLISSLYPLLTLLIDRLGYIYKNYKNIKEGEDINKSLIEIYENIHLYNNDNIINKAKEIQSCIYERRCKFAPIPNKFYNLRRKYFQKHSNEFISDLKEKLREETG
ncbi:hypothetical protein GCM10008986_35170 [Salinibacillus aidingensis]|uniref:Uncharacterized protein n=1 Tax=Salinibacillus aidingensis TaxID=237684 RepID=A0ABP3LP27_9BACI